MILSEPVDGAIFGEDLGLEAIVPVVLLGSLIGGRLPLVALFDPQFNQRFLALAFVSICASGNKPGGDAS